MPIDPSIPLSGRTPEPIDPVGIMSKMMGMRAQQQEAQVRDLELRDHQQKVADMKALDAAFQQPGGRDVVINQLPGHLRPQVSKQFADLDKIHAEAVEAKTKAADAMADAFGHGAVIIREHKYDPIAAQGVISDLKLKFGDDPQTLQQIQAFEQQIHDNPTPAAIKASVDPFIKGSKKYAELDNQAATAQARVQSSQTAADKFEAEKPKIAAETQKVQQEVAGTVPMTDAQKAMDARTKAANAIAASREKREQAKYNATYGNGVGEDGKPLPASPVAQAIAEYRVAPPSARSMATGEGKALMEQVARLNPAYDATQFPTRQKMRQAFTSGNQSQTLNSLNTAIEHLDQFADMAKTLDNGNFQPTNEIRNWFQTKTGSSAPTNFAGMKTIMAGELASAFKKSGATDAEIHDVKSAIDGKQSTSQLVDYVTKVAIPALGSKAATFDAQWKQAMGEKDPFSVYTPGAKAVLDKYGKNPTGNEAKNNRVYYDMNGNPVKK